MWGLTWLGRMEAEVERLTAAAREPDQPAPWTAAPAAFLLRARGQAAFKRGLAGT